MPDRDFSLSSYDFPACDELIAARPAEPRDASRLLVLCPAQPGAPDTASEENSRRPERASGRMEHARFSDIARFLRPGDLLVLNRTKVLPARLVGRKATGGKAELVLLSELEPGLWTALSADLKPGARVELDGERAVVEGKDAEGTWRCRFSTPDARGLMGRLGLPPLPPYILQRRTRDGTARELPEDAARYQTVYAKDDGSIAAPTAGLHFTPRLLEELREAGVRAAEIVLHVGHGTFHPLTASDIRQHRMKSERYRVPPEAAAELEACRREGGRVVAVGTTATRALESFAATGQAEGWTELFIRPGHAFRSVDALLTNFHQPRSTPLVLACAFAGRERLRAAYEEAVARRYRLYSYGDAMLIRGTERKSSGLHLARISEP